jgi:hypothetical protein
MATDPPLSRLSSERASASRETKLIGPSGSMSGSQLVVTAGRPPAEATKRSTVFTTGHNEEAERWIEAKRGKPLRKPFRIGVLLDTIRAALAA